MSLVTTSISVTQDTGWVLVATNPVYLVIQSRDGRPFQVATLASPGVPSETDILSFNSYSQEIDGIVFEKDTASTGYFYVRAAMATSETDPTRVGILFDETIVLSITVDSTAITVDTTLVTCDAS